MLLKARGVDPGQVAARAGLDPRAVDDPSALMPFTVAMRFFEEASVALDDPCLGLTVVTDATLKNYGITGFILANHPILAEGLRDMAEHVARIAPAIHLELQEGPMLSEMSIRLDCAGPGADLFVQDVLAGLAKHAPEATGGDWGVVAVHLCQAECCPDRFEATFGVTPTFGADRNSLTFRTKDLRRVVPRADPMVLTHMHEAIETQIRKRRAAAGRSASVLSLRGCVIDLGSGTVHRPDGEREALTSKERELLAFFASKANAVVTHESIERDLWGIGKNVLSYAPAVAIRRLRKKIEEDPSHPTNLVTVFGEGWKLIVPPQ